METRRGDGVVEEHDDLFKSDDVVRREWNDFVGVLGQPRLLCREATEQPPDQSQSAQHDATDRFVNPEHYKSAGIECIEYQRATSTPEEFQGYLKNCCVKYLHRMRAKDDPLKNLLKAQWYLNRLVEEFKKQS